MTRSDQIQYRQHRQFLDFLGYHCDASWWPKAWTETWRASASGYFAAAGQDQVGELAGGNFEQARTRRVSALNATLVWREALTVQKFAMMHLMARGRKVSSYRHKVFCGASHG